MDTQHSAGDVERFVYCHLNWWRGRQGEQGQGGEAGQRVHHARAKSVQEVGALQEEAGRTLQTSFLLALVAISGATLGLELAFLGLDAPMEVVLVFLAVLWLASSLYLLVFHLYFRDRATALGASARIVRGEVSYVDGSRTRGELLASRTLPLSGRPDYVVRSNGGFVPVEVKSGRTPRRPYESHLLQLAAYCHLLEQSEGARPTHGVIEYPEARFEVAYTDALEVELVRTLMRMQLAERTGNVSRSHRSVGRCTGCSRRDGCPERLDVP